MQGRDSHPADNSLAAFQSRPFFVIPLERSSGEISPFLKEFLDRSQWIVKALGIKNGLGL
jgi:hypothetical protein